MIGLGLIVAGVLVVLFALYLMVKEPTEESKCVVVTFAAYRSGAGRWALYNLGVDK